MKKKKEKKKLILPSSCVLKLEGCARFSIKYILITLAGFMLLAQATHTDQLKNPTYFILLSIRRVLMRQFRRLRSVARNLWFNFVFLPSFSFDLLLFTLRTFE